MSFSHPNLPLIPQTKNPTNVGLGIFGLSGEMVNIGRTGINDTQNKK